MKKIIFVFIVLIIVIMLICGTNFAFIKSAIKAKDLPNDKQYILVQTQYSTVAPWIIVETGEDIYIIENEPDGFNYELENGGNTFVCYGEFSDELSFTGARIFVANDWDILYPIKRNSLFDLFLPDSYICRYDTK